jgi:hypothetical protein
MTISPFTQRMLDALPVMMTGSIVLVSLVALFYAPFALSVVTLIWVWYLVARFSFALYSHLRGLRRIKEANEQNWRDLYDQFRASHPDSMVWEQVHHIILMPSYGEPIAVLRQSLSQLSTSDEATAMTVVLAMEAREADAFNKASQLRDEFAPHFERILITQHPYGVEGELAGKSSNTNYAIRQASIEVLRHHPAENIIVTVMDADTQWHTRYFSALTYAFITHSDRYHAFWQAPIRYHGKIEDLHPALRLINVFASALELSYLSSWWLSLPISSYSLSFKLLQASDFWDANVIAEDWHMFLKAYFANNGKVRVNPIYLPFIASVVGGDTFLEAVKNRYHQTVRHALGSREIGYTWANITQSPDIPLYKRMRLFGRVTHDILAASAGWTLLVLGGQVVPLIHGLGVYGGNWGVFMGLQGAFLMLTIMAISFWLIDNHVRGEPLIPKTWHERFHTVLGFVMFPALTVILLTIPVFHAQLWLLTGTQLVYRVAPKTA